MCENVKALTDLRRRQGHNHIRRTAERPEAIIKRGLEISKVSDLALDKQRPMRARGGQEEHVQIQELIAYLMGNVKIRLNILSIYLDGRLFRLRFNNNK